MADQCPMVTEDLILADGSSMAPLGFAALAMLIGVVKYGIGLHPEWRRFHDAALAWPDVASAPLIMETDRSLLSNITAAWFAGALDLQSVRWYLVYQLLVTLFAIAAPFLMPSVRRSMTQSRFMFVMIVGGPTLSLLLAWVAGYDAVFVLGAVLAALGRNPLVIGAGWFVMAFNHATLGGVALLLWLPMVLVGAVQWDRTARVIRAAVGAGGAALGALAITALTSSWGGSTNRWELYQSIDRADIMQAYWAGLPLVLFGVLGVGWFVVLDRTVRSSVLGRMMIGLALLAALGLPLVAVDQTRISALALLPAMLAFTSVAPRWFGEATLDQLGRRYVLVAAIVPVLVIWQGAVLYPGPLATRDFFALLG